MRPGRAAPPLTATAVTGSASARSRWALPVVCATTVLVIVDGVAVALALPALQRDLHLSAEARQWVLVAYTLPLGGFLLLAGRLGDVYGVRRLLLGGLALFGGGATAAALAPGTAVLVVARAVQGAGAAAATPATLALVGDLYPGRAERGRALGVVSAVGSAASLVGATAGGVLVTVAGWRWVFGACAPPALVAVLVGRWALPADAGPPGRRERPEVTGPVLVTAGLAVAIVAASEAESGASRRAVAGLAGAAAALLAGFVLAERRAARPLVPYRVLAGHGFGRVAVAVVANSGSFTALVVFGALLLQQGWGWSALAAGLALLPAEVAGLATALAVGRLPALRSRAVTTAALLVTCAGLALLARCPEHGGRYTVDVLPATVLIWVGVCAGYVALTNRTVAAAPPAARGVVTGVFETCQHLGGGALALALLFGVARAVSGPPTAGYRAALLTAAGLALLGAGSVAASRR
ncbi:MAG: MFS transporter [Mycobacteriales bacterium]